MENATNQSTTDSEGDTYELIITKATICMLVLAVSLFENILVLVVLKKDLRNRLRTANSYFIANMSVADVLFAVQNLPLAYNNLVLNGHWVLQGSIGMVLCKIDTFFSLISMVTTNLTILTIAIDRFLAVFVPFKKIITRRICFVIIFLTWLISTMFALPMLYYADLKRRTRLHTICTLEDKQILKLWYVVLAGILATTLVAMLVLYAAIGMRLWRRRKFPGNLSQTTHARREKRNRDIFKMLITLIVVFYVCYVPVITLSLSHFLGFYSVFKKKHGRFIAVVMMFINGVINPIIYYIFNERFRDGVKAALAKLGCCRRALYHVDRPMAATGRASVSANGRRSTRTSTQL